MIHDATSRSRAATCEADGLFYLPLRDVHLMGRGQWQQHRKRRAFIDLALDFNSPAMGFNNPGADGQPETCALLGVGPCFIGAIESIEDTRLILRRDSYAAIRYGHPGLSLFDRQRDVDGPARARVFDCVIEQV